MRLSHVNISMPPGSEDLARAFYTGLIGLPEIPKPESMRVRGGVWFDAPSSCDVHLSVEEGRTGNDAQRHFGLECDDLDGLRSRLTAAGLATADGRPAPWKRFYVHTTPSATASNSHEPGGLRA